MRYYRISAVYARLFKVDMNLAVLRGFKQRNLNNGFINSNPKFVWSFKISHNSMPIYQPKKGRQRFDARVFARGLTHIK